MNLPMNMKDIALWEKGDLKGFALPLKEGEQLKVGDIVNILEPFKRLTVLETVEKNGTPVERKVTAGVIYRSDGEVVWDGNRPVPSEYEEADRWSSAAQLPEYAVRRWAAVVQFEIVSLQSFTSEQIKLLHLDYASQGDPQILLEEYLPIRDFELLFQWWKQHYKSTLRDTRDPKAVFLHLTPSS